jgi:uncharacterized protein with von Willebrand factor type A (vWA) domain
MEKSLTDFAEGLRKAGIGVSPAELIDASKALGHLDLAQRSLFKDGLRSTMVKRTRDIPVFDQLFDLYFCDGLLVGSLSEASEEQPLESLLNGSPEMEQGLGSDLSPVALMIMAGQFAGLTRLLLNRLESLNMVRAQGAPLRANFFLQHLRRQMGLDQVSAETERFLDGMQDHGLDRKKARAMQDHVEKNLARLEEELENLVRNEVDRSRFLASRRIEDKHQAKRNLFRLSDKDFLAMRPAVDRLARRLRDRLALRLKLADRGRFNLKTTLRKNIGFGGPLPELHFRNKRPTRPEVVALCDVSASVANFSRFMLLFLYTLKEVIARLKIFIFMGDLAEVTLLFQQHDLNEAVSMAASGHGLQYPLGTDYGESLAQFVDEHMAEVNSKTTVIILGDARNNNLPTREECLEAISERARKLIWLNPEPWINWSLGDSVMEVYRPYCTSVTECCNLKQLSDAIEENLIP